MTWLSALAAAYFSFLPQLDYMSPWGDWYSLGWPFSMRFKIGYLSPGSPRGFHFAFEPEYILSPCLWLAVFVGFQIAVRKAWLPPKLALALAGLGFLVGAAWFVEGMVYLIKDMLIEYR